MEALGGILSVATLPLLSAAREHDDGSLARGSCHVLAWLGRTWKQTGGCQRNPAEPRASPR